MKDQGEVQKCVIELDNLVVQWEALDPYPAMATKRSIAITAVWLPNHYDPSDAGQWLDVTDHLSPEALAALFEQIEEAEGGDV